MTPARKLRQLRPIKVPASEYEAIEAHIRKTLRAMIYQPLMAELNRVRGSGARLLLNAADDADLAALAKAFADGKLRYDGKAVKGAFSARTSRAMRMLGANWDRSARAYRIAEDELPQPIRAAISASRSALEDVAITLDDLLAQILPEKIAEAIQVSSLVDKLLYKTDKEIGKTLKGLSVSPEITPAMRAKLAEQWQDNMQLDIKRFTDDQIRDLRAKVRANALAGNRFENLIGDIRASYGVSARKAKFLASQETRLLVKKFANNRLMEAGVNQYTWRCVVGSPKHPVRPAHQALNGKVFRYDDPPISTGPGQAVRRNNPGEDYNCRCYDIPLV